MDYLPVSYWDLDAERWIECGRFYQNALIIDYDLISDTQFDLTDEEIVFKAPRYDIDNWQDAPGSSNWIPSPRVASDGIFSPARVGVGESNDHQYHFGVDKPSTSMENDIIAYDNERRSLNERSNLYFWKTWSRDRYNISLSALFDVYHASINVKDISR